jgi:hypothetical protein
MSCRIMPTSFRPLKALALAALCACNLPSVAAPDAWYGGALTGPWGMRHSLGLRGALPGAFGMPTGASNGAEAGAAQFGGYRVTDSLAIEGAQTSFGSSGSGCEADPLGWDTRSNPCAGSAWSLSGVATLPFDSGFALFGRMGLRYVQKGGWEEAFTGRGSDDLASVYGIGMSFDLSRSVTVHAESELYADMPGSTGHYAGNGVGLNSSVHSIGLSIKF